ncbi:MAG: alpha amylase C-terminal domain-containing protein, partial [Rhodospirillales bacterium]|nr:alpha amylase C-terminal domain-containing protein [Rhodospirillales bacterium]
DDRENSVLSWLRFAPGAPPVAIVANFTPVPRAGYRIGLPFPGRWREVLNTDAPGYGGSGLGNLGAIEAEPVPMHGLPASAALLAPPLATVYFVHEPTARDEETLPA